MEVPCVRVPREDGEATRRELAAADLVAEGYEITVEDGWLYVPVTDPEAVDDAYEVVERAVAERETQTTPADLVAFDPSYERLGDVALIDEDDPDRARALADAIVDSDLPVETVLNKASKVKGETRVRDWELLAGEDTEVVHREYGCEYALDLAEVYFSPRLATERHRVAEQVGSEALRASEAGSEGPRSSETESEALRASETESEGSRSSEPGSGQDPRPADERAFDMFAGVGPFVVPFAKRGAECVGVDVNETAIEYLEQNARRNGVADRVTAIADDVRAVAADYEGWADRIVMNLPHSADDFLDSAVTVAGDDCVVHYYDIQHEDDPFGPGERAIREAAGTDYEVTVAERRVVRSYAPHEVNVCLDVRLTR